MIANANSTVQLAIQIKNEIMEYVNVNVEIIVYTKENYNWNRSTCICASGKYLKSSVVDSKIVRDEIIYLMDIVSANVTSISTNISITASINSDVKKVRLRYLLHIVLLVFILLFTITIICDHYAKHRSKQKSIDALTIYQWKVMNFKKFVLKIVRFITSMA